jgi:hypothetical protein
VLDVNLNGEAVYPVADVLAGRNVPFLFLTGYGTPGFPSAHAHRRVLGKPFRPPDLVRLLARELGLTPCMDEEVELSGEEYRLRP